MAIITAAMATTKYMLYECRPKPSLNKEICPCTDSQAMHAFIVQKLCIGRVSEPDICINKIQCVNCTMAYFFLFFVGITSTCRWVVNTE